MNTATTSGDVQARPAVDMAVVTLPVVALPSRQLMAVADRG